MGDAGVSARPPEDHDDAVSVVIDRKTRYKMPPPIDPLDKEK